MNDIIISLDKHKLDIEMISNFLATAYWAQGRSKHMIQTTIDKSICFGVYKDDRQIGFARVVSDHIVFAYIMDVFIEPKFQGNGYGTQLMNFIMNEPQLKDVQNWLLATSDAHNLYKKFGFTALPDPSKMMKKVS